MRNIALLSIGAILGIVFYAGVDLWQGIRRILKRRS